MMASSHRRFVPRVLKKCMIWKRHPAASLPALSWLSKKAWRLHIILVFLCFGAVSTLHDAWTPVALLFTKVSSQSTHTQPRPRVQLKELESNVVKEKRPHCICQAREIVQTIAWERKRYSFAAHLISISFPSILFLISMFLFFSTSVFANAWRFSKKFKRNWSWQNSSCSEGSKFFYWICENDDTQTLTEKFWFHTTRWGDTNSYWGESQCWSHPHVQLDRIKHGKFIMKEGIFAHMMMSGTPCNAFFLFVGPRFC